MPGTSHRIDAFLAVAEYGDYDLAGQALAAGSQERILTGRQMWRLCHDLAKDLFGDSPPALLEAIPQSERAMNDRRLRLTPVGHEVFDRARNARDAWSRLSEVAQSDYRPRIGCFPAHVDTIIAEVIFQTKIDLRLMEADPRDRVLAGRALIGRLLDGELDVVIAPTQSIPQLESIPMIAWWLSVVAPLTSTTVRSAPVSPEELAGSPLILSPKDHTSRQMVETLFHRSGVVTHVVHESRSTEVILALVEAGYGTAILPSDAVRAGRRFRQAAFINYQTGGSHSLFWSRDRVRAPYLGELIDTFVRVRDHRGLLRRPNEITRD